MKIHYTSGHFYIEKDGKKIKIANPEELPIVKYPVGTMFKHCESIVFKHSEDHFSNCIEGNTFDLPKELSVRIEQDTCKVKCERPITICPMGSCASKDEVAILSKSSSQMKGGLNQECNRTACQNSPANWYNHSTQKHYCEECAQLINKHNQADAMRLFGHDLCTEVKSSSPEIPNSSDFFESQTFKWPIIASENQLRKVKKEVNATVIDGKSEFCFGWRKAMEWANETYIKPFKKFSLYHPSPPTVAGTSDSEKPNNSEKPDSKFSIEDMIKWLHGLIDNHTPETHIVHQIVDTILNKTRDKTISDLRERVKELEDKIIK